MTELAVNQYGKAFVLPIEAKYWLVRKMSDVPRGGPAPTFDADGRPIMIPIETTMDQFHALLRSQGCAPGRYRLDALDGAQNAIKDMIAYLPFPPVAGRAVYAGRGESGDASAPSERCRNAAPPSAPVWSTGGAWPLPVPGHMTGTEYLLGEALRGQIAVNATTTGALVQLQAGAAGLMTAAAELMRAADGAGLPKRKPSAIRDEPVPRMPQVIVQQVAPPVEPYDDNDNDDDDDDDGGDSDDEPPAPPTPPGWQDKLAEVFAELAPMAKMMITAKLGDLVGGGGNGGAMGDLSALLGNMAGSPGTGGVRNAAAPPAPAPAPIVEPELAPEIDEPELDLSPAAWSHLQLVQSRLEPALAGALRDELGRMAPDARRDFAMGLMSLKLDAACDQVVGQLAVLAARRARMQAAAQRAAGIGPIGAEHGSAPASVPHVGCGANDNGSMEEGGDPSALATEAPLDSDIALDPVTAAALGFDHTGGLHATGAGEAATATAAHPETSIHVPPGYEVARTVRGKDGRRIAHLRPIQTSAPGSSIDSAVAVPVTGLGHMFQALQAGAGADSPLAELIGTFPGGATGMAAALGQVAPGLASELQQAIAPSAAPDAPHAIGAMSRLMEILPRLAPGERATAQRIAMTLPDDVRQGLLSKLVSVTLDEAVAVVKDIVARHAATRAQ